jgi:hypothetical protein
VRTAKIDGQRGHAKHGIPLRSTRRLPNPAVWMDP